MSVTNRPAGTLRLLTLLLGLALTVSAHAAPARVVKGRVVEVSLDPGRFTLSVPGTGEESIEHSFYTDGGTRVRAANRVSGFARLRPGHTATVTYVLSDDGNLAKLIEVTVHAADLGGFTDGTLGPEIVDTVEQRRRYEENVESTLSVFAEAIEELRDHPDTEGSAGLARKRTWATRLARRLDDVERRFDSLRAAGSGAAWQQARGALETALSELRREHDRARAEITNR